MSSVTDTYYIYEKEKRIGCFFIYEDGSVSYSAYGGGGEALAQDIPQTGGIPFFAALLREEHRVPGKRQRIYQDGDVTAKREPLETDEVFSVYRRMAEEGAPDYSPLPHDAPHYEGPHTPEGMREWASWYQFRKMDDGTFRAELDEAWDGGSHYDGGTIRVEIPEEWMTLPYADFLQNVVKLAAAAHFGFTADMLLQKDGLRAFFGYPAEA